MVSQILFSTSPKVTVIEKRDVPQPLYLFSPVTVYGITKQRFGVTKSSNTLIPQLSGIQTDEKEIKKRSGAHRIANNVDSL